MLGHGKSTNLTEYGGVQRRSPRLPANDEVAIRLCVGDRVYDGELLDESPGGMGIYLANNVFLPSGTRVRIVARRRCHFAVVVRCVSSDGGSIVGIRAANNNLFWRSRLNG
ncbi:MAG: PilZ domain-containing protein [Planctomycetota bacterium]